nr:hypothetical protein [Neoehrlichia mikurensis]
MIAAGVMPGILFADPIEGGFIFCNFSCTSFVISHLFENNT